MNNLAFLYSIHILYTNGKWMAYDITHKFIAIVAI